MLHGSLRDEFLWSRQDGSSAQERRRSALLFPCDAFVRKHHCLFRRTHVCPASTELQVRESLHLALHHGGLKCFARCVLKVAAETDTNSFLEIHIPLKKDCASSTRSPKCAPSANPTWTAPKVATWPGALRLQRLQRCLQPHLKIFARSRRELRGHAQHTRTTERGLPSRHKILVIQLLEPTCLPQTTVNPQHR